MTHCWTVATLETLIAHLTSGMTRAEAAAAMGISKNAVVSGVTNFIKRQGAHLVIARVPLTREEIAALNRVKAQAINAAKPPRKPKPARVKAWSFKDRRPGPAEPHNAHTRQSLVCRRARPVWHGQVSDGCQYIIGDTSTPDWRYCGATKVPGLSWCADCLPRLFDLSARVNRSSVYNGAVENRA